MAIEQKNTYKEGRGFFSNTNLDYGQAGMVSRSLTNWMLTHSTIESWVQFYHKPYQCDIAEAIPKAIARYEYESGERWTNSQSFRACTYVYFNTKDKKKKEK